MVEAQNEFLQRSAPEFQQVKLEQLLKEKGIANSNIARSGEAIVVHTRLPMFGGKSLEASQSIEQALKVSGIDKFSSVVTSGMLPVIPFTVDCFAIGMVSKESKKLTEVPKPKGISIKKTPDNSAAQVSVSYAWSWETRKHVTSRIADMANYAFHAMGTTDIRFDTTLSPINQLVGLRLKRT